MSKINFQEIKKLLPEVQKNISLTKYTTFRIGGPAKYFFAARNKEDLIKAVSAAKKNKLPFFILGSGSNILINDKGFSGLIIKNEARDFKIKNNLIITESGAILSKVIDASIKAGLSGLVEGSGIPGTLGGAVYGNAGWSKGAWTIGSFVKEVKLLMPDGKIKKANKKWLSFNYRSTRLKKMKGGKPVILEIILELPARGGSAFGGKKGVPEDLERRRKEILETRFQKIPRGFSAGSIFKNPPPKKAGYLIEECGFKGKRIGNVKVSEIHANFIVNSGRGQAKDVLNLIKLIKNKVKRKFKINLEEEIEFIGS